jgi:hypothetical protein
VRLEDILNEPRQTPTCEAWSCSLAATILPQAPSSYPTKFHIAGRCVSRQNCGHVRFTTGQNWLDSRALIRHILGSLLKKWPSPNSSDTLNFTVEKVRSPLSLLDATASDTNLPFNRLQISISQRTASYPDSNLKDKISQDGKNCPVSAMLRDGFPALVDGQTMNGRFDKPILPLQRAQFSRLSLTTTATTQSLAK